MCVCVGKGFIEAILKDLSNSTSEKSSIFPIIFVIKETSEKKTTKA